MKSSKTSPRAWALILILCAIAGAGISYHFTLEARFTALEQKLDQNSLALERYQTAQEETVSAKTEALNNLNKEIDSLQSSLQPLDKTTKDQNTSLVEIRKQITVLQQSQQSQQEAQKKLADYAHQLETLRHEIQLSKAEAFRAPDPVLIPPPARQNPVPPPVVAAPASHPAPVALPVSAAPSGNKDEPAPDPLPIAPHAETKVNLRSDERPIDIPGAVGAGPQVTVLN